MLTVSLSGKKIKSAFLSIILVLVLFGTTLLLFYIRESEKIYLSDEAEIVAFLEGKGYSPIKISEEEIIIPTVWNETFENYNLLQKEQGFDLHNLREKTVMKYSFSSGDSEITLLIFDGVLVGSDVFSYEERESKVL
ncbi:MAG: DUF4830 domain-containing protein [Oscillospiraceae bacterium]|nr:DUF4830 domain-containing protein [Oscillospiraceae bacterium]